MNIWRLRSAQRVSALGLAGALAITAFGTAGAAQATPRPAPEKITICHRTHSTTNPYRMITVSRASVDGELNVYHGTEPHNTNGDHAGMVHNGYKRVHGDLIYPETPLVFDPTFSYIPNEKVWQDIIPSFVVTDGVASLDAGSYDGLNWSTAGKNIYYGLNGMQGLCRKMSAFEFAQVETEALQGQGLNDNQIRQQVLDDLREQNAEGDPTNLTNLDDLPETPAAPKGPKTPNDLNDLIDELSTENENAATPADITQAIAGVVWYDDNNDGEQQDNELPAEGVDIQLYDPITEEIWTPEPVLQPTSQRALIVPAFATSSSSTRVSPATTIPSSVTTNANGYFQFLHVPAGSWIVRVITPSGYVYTYDSAGDGDGNMPGTEVPEGGVGFAWAGLITGGPDANGGSNDGSGDGNSFSTQTGGSSDLATTGGDAAAFGMMASGSIVFAAVVLLWQGRRRSR